MFYVMWNKKCDSARKKKKKYIYIYKKKKRKEKATQLQHSAQSLIVFGAGKKK